MATLTQADYAALVAGSDESARMVRAGSRAYGQL
jgi:hypothetical protein